MKLTSILEGLKSSFQSKENVNLELLDFEFQIKAEDIAQYMKSFPNRNVVFESPDEKKSKFNIINGRKSGSRLSKISLYDQIFSLNIKNIIRIEISNLKFFL